MLGSSSISSMFMFLLFAPSRFWGYISYFIKAGIHLPALGKFLEMFLTVCSRLQGLAKLLIHPLKPRMDKLLHCLQYFKLRHSWLELSHLVGFRFGV